MSKRSRENPVNSIDDSIESRNLILSKASTVFKHVELSLTILEKNVGLQSKKQFIKWKDVENGTQLSLQPSSSSSSSKINVITVDDFALIYAIAPVLYTFECIQTTDPRLSSPPQASSSTPPSLSVVPSLADFSSGFYIKSNNDIFLNQNNDDASKTITTTRTEKSNPIITATTLLSSPSMSKLTSSSSTTTRTLSVPALIELRKNYFRDALDNKLNNNKDKNNKNNITKKKNSITSLKDGGDYLQYLETIDRSIFIINNNNNILSSAATTAVVASTSEDTQNALNNKPVTSAIKSTVATKTKASKSSSSSSTTTTTVHDRLSAATAASAYESPSSSSATSSSRIPPSFQSTTPIKAINSISSSNNNNNNTNTGNEFYDSVIRPFVSPSRITSSSSSLLQRQQPHQSQETDSSSQIHSSILHTATDSVSSYSNSPIFAQHPLLSFSSSISISNNSSSNNNSSTVRPQQPIISSLSLEGLKNLAIERGKVQQAIQTKIRQEKEDKMCLARLNHILFVADTIRSIYTAKNKNSYVMSELISRLVMELPDVSQKDISDIIQILIQQTPEFFVYMPRDAVCKQDVLRLNFHCNYSTQTRRKLIAYVNEMKKKVNSHLEAHSLSSQTQPQPSSS